jgi:hypothetical protein
MPDPIVELVRSLLLVVGALFPIVKDPARNRIAAPLFAR